MPDLQEVKYHNFNEDVVRSSLPVLVMFYCFSCGSSNAIEPMLERLAAEFTGRAKLVKIDVQSEPELALQFSVSNTPGFAFFLNERVVGKAAGIVEETVFRSYLTRLIELKI